MTPGINERQILTKHIPCKCKFKFDGSKCHSIQRWNKDKCLCGKTFCVRKKYIQNPAICTCENDKYYGIYTDNSVIICDEIKSAVDTVSTNVNIF